MIWTCRSIVLTLFTRIASAELTCFLDLKPDPLHDSELRWGLLIDKTLRCSCTKILAKSKIPILPCFSQPLANDITEIWFTDTPGLLSDRSVWITEKLKYLLDCSYIALCEPGWHSFESYCYHLQDENDETGMVFNEAEDRCQSLGSNLVSIHSINESEFVLGLIGSTNLIYWIGLTDSVTEESFVWTDNTQVNYTNWRFPEPDGDQYENCVAILPNDFGDEWIDAPCEFLHHFICKKKVTTG